MLYSQTAVEFLRRKRIRRDVLFQYLHENDVIVPVSAEKAQLISKCLEFWGSDVNQNSLQLEVRLCVAFGARCSSVVRAYAHGAMGHRINPS